MAEAKISISLGALTFSGEGEEVWLASQLDKVLEKAAAIPAARIRQAADDATPNAPESPEVDAGNGEVGTLASYLTSTKSGTNQVRRFLATADWLHKKGSKRLKTADVSKALQDNHQKRLSNPADCLGQNVGKGHCEKVGKEFFVTDDGRTALGT